jgi:predicted O-methyltransferase YrrM
MSRARKKVRKLRRLLQDDVPRPQPAKANEPQVLALDSVNAGRFLFFDDLIMKTRDVPGDIVECGVGEGVSMLLMAHIVHARQLDKQLWGFDSFEGFPEPTPEDESHRAAQKGEWSLPKQQALELLRSHLDDELFFRSHISLIKGFFEDSLGVHKGPIALLHLDCDLYQSYKVCLETLYPKVSPGGIVAFDEYHREGDVWPGAPKAIDEFFADKQVELVKDQLYGKFYVVKPAG